MNSCVFVYGCHTLHTCLFVISYSEFFYGYAMWKELITAPGTGPRHGKVTFLFPRPVNLTAFVDTYMVEWFTLIYRQTPIKIMMKSILINFNSKHTNIAFLKSQSENTERAKYCIRENVPTTNYTSSPQLWTDMKIMCNHSSNNTKVQIKSFSAVKTVNSYLKVLYQPTSPNLIKFILMRKHL